MNLKSIQESLLPHLLKHNFAAELFKNLDKKKLLALGLLFLILIGFGSIHLVAENYGKSLYLETVPYDPVDLFRGDYVNLQYEIENLDMDLVDKSMYEKVNESGNIYYKIHDDAGYLIYEEDSNPLKAISLVPDRPSGSNYIKTKLFYIDEYAKKARLSIGLNRFYVPEGTGTELENLSRQGRLVVEIKKLGPFYTLEDISKLEEK